VRSWKLPINPDDRLLNGILCHRNASISQRGPKFQTSIGHQSGGF
jgi:hypothetical protein